MRSKSIMAAISLICSIGGWFLWNIILSATYNPTSQIYKVRDSLFHKFGRSFNWWLTLILILASAIVFEIGVSSLRAAFFTTQEDIFAVLEKDPGVKGRFEEAAAVELQAGWDRRTKKEREEEEARRKEEERLRKEEEERGEREVKEMLRTRAANHDEADERSGDGADRRSGDVEEMLRKGFGRVWEGERRGSEAR